MPDNIQKLLDNYNQALDRDTQAQMDSLETARMNNFASINNAAKANGILHSNYPELKQVQYLGGTYAPAVSKLQTSLLTTKDEIKSKAQDILDQIDAYNQETARLNSYYGGGSSGRSSGGSSGWSSGGNSGGSSGSSLYTAGWDTPAVQGDGIWTANSGQYGNQYTGSWDVNGYRWLWNSNTNKFELAGKAE